MNAGVRDGAGDAVDADGNRVTSDIRATSERLSRRACVECLAAPHRGAERRERGHSRLNEVAIYYTVVQRQDSRLMTVCDGRIDPGPSGRATSGARRRGARRPPAGFGLWANGLGIQQTGLGNKASNAHEIKKRFALMNPVRPSACASKCPSPSIRSNTLGQTMPPWPPPQAAWNLVP